jgi:hypothetical protein
MADLSLVTDGLLPVSSETYASTLSAGIAAGAATVPVFSSTAYAEGDVVVLTVDPGTANQATFRGTKQGNDFINCKWTEGNVGASHSSGATIIDYDSSTHYNLVTKAVRAHANSDGTLKTTAVQAALNIATTSVDWQPLATTPTVVSSNGQREHVIRYTGVNYTDRINEGFKLRVPRTGTTPTTSMAFVSASSQYASKPSPTGFSFTTQYTIETWVYLDSFKNQGFVSKNITDGTDGFRFYSDTTGVLAIENKGRYATTYQSLPLNKWTHIAAAVDTTANTVVFYIDDVTAPGTSLSGTGALVQVGDLRLGSSSIPSTQGLNGKLAVTRIWSTIRTAAEIRDNANKEVPASTTGLVGQWKGNGSWNDSSANANHLIASGGAVNNFASHPYSAVEYAKIMKVAYTGGNTDVTIFTGPCVLPNETLGATSYSSVAEPYGFPASSNKWALTVYLRVASPVGNTSGTYYQPVGLSLLLPTGSWKLSYNFFAYFNKTNAIAGMNRTSLSTSASAGTLSAPTNVIPDSMTGFYTNALAADYGFEHVLIPTAYDNTAATTIFAQVAYDNTNSNSNSLRGDMSQCKITAECAYA